MIMEEPKQNPPMNQGHVSQIVYRCAKCDAEDRRLLKAQKECRDMNHGLNNASLGSMEREVSEIRNMIRHMPPICPICLTKMWLEREYCEGEFNFTRWTCKCDDLFQHIEEFKKETKE